MDENRVNILNESRRLISKLQLLSVFFENDTVYKIYLRTQVIHRLFESNNELDINKLDLFHLQFTVTLIELLKKIKRNNERNLTLLFDETQANKDLIAQLQDNVSTERDFNLDKQRQSLKINTSLRNLYRVLSEDSSEYPFSKNINAFGAKYAADFFYDISGDVLQMLIQYDPANVYKHSSAIIQRKLMGLLCKYDFKTEFVFGLKAEHLEIEVYKFTEADQYYIYYPSRSLFLLCDINILKDIDRKTALAKKENILRELMDKNDRLQSNISITKTYIPPEVKNVLTDYYRKINDVDFLQQMNNFDAQSNILRTMLNTDLL